ncbi:MAG: putative toxin-antitoxin system toxin component, PIN family [Planctomyces sp.]|nr:putative toxin-antitoxin system toxin component, PIN family [Planctomyces sp.]
MRIVLDSNILARAACGPPSPAAELLIRTLRSPYTICMSPVLLDELNRILRYDRVRKMHRMQDSEIDAFIDHLRLSCLMVEPTKSKTPVSTDPDDDWVIATALQAESKVICTLDRHLKTAAVIEYCQQRGIEVLSDVELLARLKSA